jgi:F0F1-type ATP synthase assembly protein I
MFFRKKELNRLQELQSVSIVKNTMPPEKKNGILRDLAVYGQSGSTFAFCVVIGLCMGWYLDDKVFAGRTAPWLTFIFLGFGIAAGFKQLWDLSRKIAQDDEKHDKK